MHQDADGAKVERNIFLNSLYSSSTGLPDADGADF